MSYGRDINDVFSRLNWIIFSRLMSLPNNNQPLRVAISNFHNEETGKGCKPLTQSLAEGFEQYFHRNNSLVGNKFEVVPRQGLNFIENECSIANRGSSCTHSELVAKADIFITGSWNRSGRLTVKAILFTQDGSTRTLAVERETVDLQSIAGADRTCWLGTNSRRTIGAGESQSDPRIVELEAKLAEEKRKREAAQRQAQIEATIPSNASSIRGDFNGDGQSEVAWVETPEIDENESMACVGECNCVIKFSNEMPSITIEGCISGGPVNHGDLNTNGTDEIGILPGWFTSSWRAYHVFTYNGSKWIDAVEPISTHGDQWSQGYQAIEKNGVGYVKIYYSDVGDNGIEVKSKTVKVNK